MKEIMVSVYMLTYNHEKYISQALDSVLKQKTNFNFEIVIGDDASTDNTQEILREYKRNFPDKIKLICRKKNIGALKNAVHVRSKCEGKYLAILEGDDFWCDEYKLQKQIDFLEKHQDYSGCFADCDLIKDAYYKASYTKKDINSIDEYLGNDVRLLSIPTATLVYRNFFKEEPQLRKYFSKNKLIGDRILHILILKKGKIKYLPEKLATYRYITKGKNSFSSQKAIEKQADFRIASKVCRYLSGEKYYKRWNIHLSKTNYELLQAYMQEKRLKDAIKLFFVDMTLDEQRDVIKYSFSLRD